MQRLCDPLSISTTWISMRPRVAPNNVKLKLCRYDTDAENVVMFKVITDLG